MTLQQIVDVQITRDTQVPTRAGFGTPLFWAYHTLFPERVRLIGDASELLDLGAAVSSPVYLGALAAFSQNPKPSIVAIGRRATPFTMVVRLTPTVLTVGHRYRFDAVSPGGVVTEIDYTVPEGADLDDVCDALIGQLDPVAGVDASGTVQVITLTPTDTSPSFEYEFTILVDDVITTIAHTNGGSETATTISDAFRTQINAIAGTSVVASGTATCVITAAAGKSFLLDDVQDEITVVDSSPANTSILLRATTPGAIFDLRGLPMSGLTVNVETTDPGIAADFAALLAEDPSRWYAMTLDHASQAQVVALAPLVEAIKKVCVVGLSDSELFDAGDDTDTASVLKAATRSRTAIFALKNQISGFHAMALLGKWLPYDPGSETVAMKTISGVSPDTLSTSEVLAAIGDGEGVPGKWFTIYTNAGGINVTRNGNVPDGDYLDTIRGVDALAARLAENIYGLLARLPKLPFTDPGILQVVGVARTTIKTFVDVGFIAADPPFVVTAPLASEVALAFKSTRTLPDLRFTATLAGAIHRVRVRGTVSL